MSRNGFYQMNYSKIKTIDIANGVGCRTSLFVSGCSIHCKGCFNSETWDYNAGKLFDDSTIDYILQTMHPYYVNGLSILGGEPLDPKNVTDVWDLIKQTREMYKDRKDIWLWTGYTYEALMARILNDEINDKSFRNIMFNIDILVEGPFEEDKKEFGLRFRGSSNQKIIDMNRTRNIWKKTNNVLSIPPIEWEDDKFFGSHSWTK